jgi:hypothetical protein
VERELREIKQSLRPRDERNQNAEATSHTDNNTLKDLPSSIVSGPQILGIPPMGMTIGGMHFPQTLLQDLIAEYVKRLEILKMMITK